MRKLKLDTDELVVETFNPAVLQDAHKGTVHANASDFAAGCTIDYACTRDVSCYWELCQEQPTNSPIYRQCYTPYVECSTEGYTCDYC
jgi:hypothetical protein